MKQRKLRIVITGGGTGGHITPALAVAEALKKQDVEVVFIGSVNGPEKQLVKQAKLPFYGIQAGKLRRYASWENLIDAFRVVIGLGQAWMLLMRLKPVAVFAKGGFVSVPVAYAAHFLEIPVVAHESDVVMGLANRLVLNKAEVMCTGFPVAAYPSTMRPKLHFTGNPIRELFRQKLPSRATLLDRYELTSSRPVVLALGGSQGARGINRLLLDDLALFLEDFQLIHITGQLDNEWALRTTKQLPPRLLKRYRQFSFVHDELVEYMALADVVVSRSSANVLNELAWLKKPTILIPLPSSASDHQRANAQLFAERSAAKVFEEDQLTSQQLHQELEDLLKDKAQREAMARSIHQFSSPQAVELIAEIILKVARQG